MRRRELVWKVGLRIWRKFIWNARSVLFAVCWFTLSLGFFSIFGMIHDFGLKGIVETLLLFGAGIVTLGFLIGWHRETSTFLTQLVASAGPEEHALQEHRKRIVWELLGRAALCDRAAVESLARDGKVAEGQRGVGRQRTLAVARLEPVWARLSEAERNLLIADEGSWAWDEVWPWIVRGEDVRVMRWVIGMDEVLRPFEFLEPDLSLVFRTTTHAEETNGERCLAAYDLRPAQAMAQAMVNRCAAEGVRRGDFKEEDDGVRAELVFMAERMGADEGADFVIGAKTVGNASEQEVRWVGQAALRRMKVLEGLIAYLNGGAEAELRIEGVPQLAE